MPKFTLLNEIDYPEFESVTNPDTGKRYYQTPSGPLTSVTTILSSLPHPELDEWRERVGEEEAARVSKEATTIGSYMHDMLECYVKGIEFQKDGTDLEKTAAKMFQCLKLMALPKVTKVSGVEVPLYCPDLYAGRTDLIAHYQNIPSVIDYKTTKFLKQAKYLENYKMQIAAYSIAHEEMFGDDAYPIRQGVILLGIRPNPQFRKPPGIQTVIMDYDELCDYKVKWLKVVEEFYENQ